ncbi:SdpI family protein [Nonlabens ponticola]|uniref:DUF1648 domain-containing protein n=1 Tax=Nonlabens ponticola TaxID=2496866 RepID=A0A3S9MWT1_9FLAO|nr:SdpI family protein [Nonlabens ponticola]AZQ43671.1 DUF1648 domain-containing protein [Nonlabens ponticola]
MTSRRFEIMIIILTILPFIYLAFIYAGLPDQVPMHFDLEGNVNRYGHKSELWILPAATTGLIYFLLKYLPAIDPKKQIEKMGSVWIKLRLGFAAAMCIIAVFGIYYIDLKAAGDTISIGIQWIYAAVGLLFLILGNYLPSIKSNYFVGIRTPWTLENDQVWRATHQLGGYLFMAAGALIIISALTLTDQWTFYILLGTTIVITLTSFIYSYTEFKKITS